jgi:hypothetical protein
MTQNGKSRADLTREANVVRSKLMRTVEQLDQRRHQIQGLRVEVQQKVKRFAATAALVLVAAVGAAAYTVQRMVGAGVRRRRARWQLAKRVWVHPDRAMRSERSSFLGEVVRSLLLTIATTVVTLPARRAVTLLLQGKKKRSDEEAVRGH